MNLAQMAQKTIFAPNPGKIKVPRLGGAKVAPAWSSSPPFCENGRGEAIFSNIFCSMRRMTTKVGALKSPDTGGPSRYAEDAVLIYRKFFTRLWSWRVQPKNVDNQFDIFSHES